jgi:glycosyltransferase involved in cell wall biosynthesis
VLRGFGLELRLTRALAARPSAAILFTTTSPWSALVDAVATATCSTFHVPVIHYLHTEGMSRLASRNRLWRRIVLVMLRRADVVVASSDGVADDIRRLVRPERIATIPNTIVDPPQGDAGIAPGTPRTVLFLSNLLPGKGAGDFVELAGALAGEFGDVTFLLAGAPADRAHAAELARRITELGLRERVELLGEVSAARRTELLRSAELFVFPSRYPEAQPLVLLEALASGVPTVAYRTPGTAGVIDDGTTGSLVPFGQVDLLIAAARESLAHPELRPERSAACRRRFDLEFSREVYRTNWRRLLPETRAASPTPGDRRVRR